MATLETSKRPGKSAAAGLAAVGTWPAAHLPFAHPVGVFVYGLIGSNEHLVQDNHSAAQLAGNQPIRFVS